jgi:hypothetical protein
VTIADAYTEFYLSTDKVHLSKFAGGRVKEQLTLQNYSLRRAFTGADPKKVIQNGSAIRNYVQVAHKNTAHFWGLDTTEAVTDPQLVEAIETPWAFMRDGVLIEETLFDLHEGDMAQKFFDLREAQDQQLWIEKCRFMEENAFWATPNPTLMEVTNPKPPVRHTTPWNVLVNEEANAIPTAYSGASVNTVQGLSRVTNANWRCQQKSYAGGPQQSAVPDTLLTSLSHMSRVTRFRGLPLGMDRYSNKSTMPAVVWCSFEGYTMLEEDVRNRQDQFVSSLGTQDPGYPAIQVHGVPFEELPILSTAAIFVTGTPGVYTTELAADKAGPRFFFMNLRDMYPVVHATKFFYKRQPLPVYNQPTKRIVYVDSFCNLNAESCRSSGIVYPSADITGYGA